MDIYLTAKSSGERLRFPLLPDRINVKTGTLPVTFQIIKLGETQIPRGTTLTGYSWNGVFPGQSMSDASFVFDWQEPNAIIRLLNEWESKGEPLTLMVTETTINADVFVESFTFEHYGIDNVSYTLNLKQLREIYVSTTPPPSVPTEASETKDPEESNKQYGTVNTTSGSGLFIRKTPSTSSTILGQLKNRSRVEILGRTGSWYIIPFESGTDGKAYIYASYVKMDGSGASDASAAKSNSSSAKTATTPTSSTSNTSTKKSLTVDIPGTNLVNAASAAVKKVVTSVKKTERDKVSL